MAIPKEAIERILNFDPGRVAVEGQRIDLGKIDGDVDIVYGNYAYQKRLIGVRGEPLVFGTTVQPIVALERRDDEGRLVEVCKLAYATDVEALGGDLVSKVLDRLAATKARQKVAV